MRILLAVSFLLAACAAAPQKSAVSTTHGQRDLDALVSFFTGNWDAKPKEPPMRLRVAEFWKGSPVRWFYLEWTRPGEPGPTRQLVFRVFEPTGHEEHFLDGDVFSLPDPARYVGEWSKAEPFTALKPGDLRLVEECNLDVVRTMTVAFTLITAGNRCPGDVAGSPYMRFEFSLTSSELDLLEQPRDTRGNVPPNSRLDPFHYWRMTREPS